jgi:hypothetical protein
MSNYNFVTIIVSYFFVYVVIFIKLLAEGWAGESCEFFVVRSAWEKFGAHTGNMKFDTQ